MWTGLRSPNGRARPPLSHASTILTDECPGTKWAPKEMWKHLLAEEQLSLSTEAPPYPPLKGCRGRDTLHKLGQATYFSVLVTQPVMPPRAISCGPHKVLLPCGLCPFTSASRALCSLVESRGCQAGCPSSQRLREEWRIPSLNHCSEQERVDLHEDHLSVS